MRVGIVEQIELFGLLALGGFAEECEALLEDRGIAMRRHLLVGHDCVLCERKETTK
jgi:hypothetical protein